LNPTQYGTAAAIKAPRGGSALRFVGASRTSPPAIARSSQRPGADWAAAADCLPQPNPEAIMSASFTPVIIAHTLAALIALGLGAAIFFRPKGSSSHRQLGRLWAGLMLVVAISSFWIKGGGHFSWLHGLSGLTLLSLSGAVYYAMAGKIARHRQAMIGLFTGSLVVAGLFTLLPQRLLGRMLWQALGLL
jgi:uncharacterized membrane protein